MRVRRAAFVIATAVALGVTACVAPPPPMPADDGAEPPGFPAAYYGRAIAAGQDVYRVDAAASVVVIEVRRGGSMAHLGHDHVVAAHDVHGFVLPAEQRADLYVDARQLVVDEPSTRKQAGFDTQLTDDAIAGTRANMLNRVLDAEKFPFVRIRVDRLLSGSAASVSMTLHGTTRELKVPVTVTQAPDALSAGGEFVVRQTDFGIIPLSLFAGAIEVQDAVTLRFALRAARATR